MRARRLQAFRFKCLTKNESVKTRITTHQFSNYYSLGLTNRQLQAGRFFDASGLLGFTTGLAGLLRGMRPGTRRCPCMLVTPVGCAS